MREKNKLRLLLLKNRIGDTEMRMRIAEELKESMVKDEGWTALTFHGTTDELMAKLAELKKYLEALDKSGKVTIREF